MGLLMPLLVKVKDNTPRLGSIAGQLAFLADEILCASVENACYTLIPKLSHPHKEVMLVFGTACFNQEPGRPSIANGRQKHTSAFKMTACTSITSQG
jgi:hypothetical protein